MVYKRSQKKKKTKRRKAIRKEETYNTRELVEEKTESVCITEITEDGKYCQLCKTNKRVRLDRLDVSKRKTEEEIKVDSPNYQRRKWIQRN